MKFPKIKHLPWSPSVSKSDKILSEKELDLLLSKPLMITEKLDGENFSLFRDRVHARSESGAFHPSQDYIKSLWARKRFKIPDGVQIVGEYLWAVHSIEYPLLNKENIYQIFMVIQNGRVYSWEETIRFASEIGLPTVPVIEESIIIERNFVPNVTKSAFGSTIEGFVFRNPDSFLVKDFSINIAKWVRPNHVQSDEHWTKNWRKQPNL